MRVEFSELKGVLASYVVCKIIMVGESHQCMVRIGAPGRQASMGALQLEALRGALDALDRAGSKHVAAMNKL